jgi:hypothetical protein
MTVSQIAKRALLAGVVVTSIIAIVAATAGALISDLAGNVGSFRGGGAWLRSLGVDATEHYVGIQAWQRRCPLARIL